MDAVRDIDGKRVYIKRLTNEDNETNIATLMYPPGSVPQSQNHSVPILAVITSATPPTGIDVATQDAPPTGYDPAEPRSDRDEERVTYLVMSFLLPINTLPFDTVDQIVDLMEQLLEVRMSTHVRELG